MRSIRSINILWLLPFVVSACVYPYEADVPKGEKSILVVEGDIIVNGTTRVRLSRTTSLQELFPAVEQGAQVYIEDEQGGRYPVPEFSPGQYEAQTSHLSREHRYRLHITLSNQAEYASEYTPVCVSPPIDKVDYTLSADSTVLHMSQDTVIIPSC